MPTSLLLDAFEHHVWATLRLIDACLPLTDEQLATAAPGTYGSILETMRHLVGADCSYLRVLSGGATPDVDADALDLAALRAVMERNGESWRTVLAVQDEPDRMLARRRDDGSEYHAPAGIRLAQVVHHGTDHRSHICSALTVLGVVPPEIDVWDYGQEAGRSLEVPPPA